MTDHNNLSVCSVIWEEEKKALSELNLALVPRS